MGGGKTTGIANAILQPAFYEQNRVAVNRGEFLIIEGTLQKQEGVVSVKASAVGILALSEADLESHDSRQVQSLAAKCCMEIQGDDFKRKIIIAAMANMPITSKRDTAYSKPGIKTDRLDRSVQD